MLDEPNVTPTDQWARWAELRGTKAKCTPILLQLRPRVGAAWSNLRLILDGLAREIGKRQSGSLDQRGPRINPVPEPLSRAMGGFGLGSRTEQNDRLHVLLLPNEHGLR